MVSTKYSKINNYSIIFLLCFMKNRLNAARGDRSISTSWQGVKGNLEGEAEGGVCLLMTQNFKYCIIYNKNG